MTQTLAALEFDRVLKLVASHARTESGQQLILSTRPRFDAGDGSRSFGLAREVETLVTARGALTLSGIDDAGLLAGGAATDLAVDDLNRLVAVVRRIVEVRRFLEAAGNLGPELVARLDRIPSLDGLLAYCEQRIDPNGQVPDTASPALSRARAARERSRQAIVAALDRLRREHPQLTAPFTIRRDRYCVPVPSGERHAVPGLVLDSSGSGASLFVEPMAVVELNNALIEASSVAREEEERVIREVAAAIARQRDAILAAAATLAELDAFQARILFGRACQARLLPPGGAGRLRLVSARHPLLDPSLAPLRREALGEEGSRRPVVPLDLDVPDGDRLLLLSGPNAGGKTVALKTIGLTALMAQAGIPVLAEEGSVLPAFSRVWCHIGDEQNLLSDLSTFSGAMRATAELLAAADERTLVLYDELGSGTDPEEGAALAAAILEELARRRCWTVATAHLTTVAAHLEHLEGAVNGAMGFDETRGRPTYRLRLGLPGRSRGLAIAEGCGVPAALLGRAREMVSRGFLTIDTYLERLQQEREALERERDEAALERSRLRDARHSLEHRREELAGEETRLRARLEEERERLRRRSRERLDEVLGELQRAREAGELPGRKRVASLRHRALSLVDAGEEAAATPPPPPALAPGARVRLRGGSTTATVLSTEGDRVEITAGGTRMWVEAADCIPVAPPPGAPTVETSVVAPAAEAAAELKLLGYSREDAREELLRFLDHCYLSGVRHVRVVHGHGSGVIRAVVREVLAEHPAVVSFGHPPQARGGTGATEAELEAR